MDVGQAGAYSAKWGVPRGRPVPRHCSRTGVLDIGAGELAGPLALERLHVGGCNGFQRAVVGALLLAPEPLSSLTCTQPRTMLIDGLRSTIGDFGPYLPLPPSSFSPARRSFRFRLGPPCLLPIEKRLGSKF